MGVTHPIIFQMYSRAKFYINKETIKSYLVLVRKALQIIKTQWKPFLKMKDSLTSKFKKQSKMNRASRLNQKANNTFLRGNVTHIMTRRLYFLYKKLENFSMETVNTGQKQKWSHDRKACRSKTYKPRRPWLMQQGDFWAADLCIAFWIALSRTWKIPWTSTPLEVESPEWVKLGILGGVGRERERASQT